MGSLSTGQGLVSDAKQKALNDFFGSVFTKEDITDIPVPDSCFDGGCEAKLVDIVIDPETVLRIQDPVISNRQLLIY